MSVSRWRSRINSLIRSVCPPWSRWSGLKVFCTTCLLALVCLLPALTPGAIASLNDDNYDGNIFALYAGNGSLVPPRINLEESLRRGTKPTLLVLYLDDSKDCKAYSATVSRIQEFYGRAANLIPFNIDAIPVKSEYEPTEVGYYYQGVVPQTVLIDEAGQVLLDEAGQVPFEKIDDIFRKVFDLLPRSESVELKRRPLNELNVELVE